MRRGAGRCAPPWCRGRSWPAPRRPAPARPRSSLAVASPAGAGSAGARRTARPHADAVVAAEPRREVAPGPRRAPRTTRCPPARRVGPKRRSSSTCGSVGQAGAQPVQQGLLVWRAGRPVGSGERAQAAAIATAPSRFGVPASCRAGPVAQRTSSPASPSTLPLVAPPPARYGSAPRPASPRDRRAHRRRTARTACARRRRRSRRRAAARSTGRCGGELRGVDRDPGAVPVRHRGEGGDRPHLAGDVARARSRATRPRPCAAAAPRPARRPPPPGGGAPAGGPRAPPRQQVGVVLGVERDHRRAGRAAPRASRFSASVVLRVKTTVSPGRQPRKSRDGLAGPARTPACTARDSARRRGGRCRSTAGARRPRRRRRAAHGAVAATSRLANVDTAAVGGRLHVSRGDRSRGHGSGDRPRRVRACPGTPRAGPGHHPGHPAANARVAGQQAGAVRWHS